MQYELSRGSNDKDRHVICREGQFYALVPTDVRQRGPWQVLSRGNVNTLKPENRLVLARDGWLNVETHPLGFAVTNDT